MARNPEMGGGRARSGSQERGIQGDGRKPDRPRAEGGGVEGPEGGGGEQTKEQPGLVQAGRGCIDAA